MNTNTLPPFTRFSICSLLLAIAVSSISAPAARAQQNVYPVPLPAEETDLVSMFDGKTLEGWDGQMGYWRVENNCIVGEITAANRLTQNNSFLVWHVAHPADFELVADYRISDHGNSGFNYRSEIVPGNPYLLRGYQADIDGENRNANGVRYTGQNYEEKGRTFLGLRGQMTLLLEGQKPQILASLGDTKQMESFIKNGDWNQYRIIARGPVLIQALNGHLMSVVIDNDATKRKLDGLIGIELHVGPPMKMEVRSIKIKQFAPVATTQP